MDKEFAVESAPSEWNAWKKYSYTNVGVAGVTPAKMFYGKQGYISINSEEALGDIIGFRVYVVNLDGTLVDPDGRAFYVQVGNQKQTADLVTAADGLVAKLNKNVAFNGSNYFSEKVALTEGVFDGAENDLSQSLGYFDEEGRFITGWVIDTNPTAYGNNVVTPIYGRDYKISYLDKNGHATDDADEAVYAVVNILKPQMFLDNGTYTAHATLVSSNQTEIREVKVSFTKKMPTEVNALAWAAGYDPEKQVFTNTSEEGNVYKIEAGSDIEALKLTDKIVDLSSNNYTLYVKGVKSADDETVKVEANQYLLKVPGKKDIDGKARTIAYDYNFGPISLTFNYQTAEYNKDNYKLTAEKTLAMNFNSWSDFEEISWEAPTLIYRAAYNGIQTPVNVLSTSVTGKAPLTVKYNNGAGLKDYTVYKYTLVDGTEKYAIEVPVTAGGQTKAYYLVLDAVPTAGVTVNGTLDEDGIDAFQSRVAEEVDAQGNVAAENAIYAWNTQVANYSEDGKTPIFGTATKKALFFGLSEYLDNVEVSFAPASLYSVAYNNGVLTFTQKTYTVNPTTEGTVTIKAKDCFGHEKTWTLKVNIAK